VITWPGAVTVPVSSSLSLAYIVWVPVTVPPAVEPYVNEVVARTDDGSTMGPATAALHVGEPNLTLSKAVSSEEVVYGDPVTYTVVFANEGHLTGTLTAITDTLDPGLTFGGMADGSDVTAMPDQDGQVLVWQMPLDVPPLDALTIIYTATSPMSTAWITPLCNHVEASAEDLIVESLVPSTCFEVGPEAYDLYLPAAYAGFTWAHLEIDKSVTPQGVEANSAEQVEYTVTIENVGDTPATLDGVTDILPPGFTFIAMAAGSDINENPSGTTGTIVWDLEEPVAAHDQIQLIYTVEVDTEPGAYDNSVTATASQGTVQEEPATATLYVDVPIVGLEAFNDSPSRLGEPTTLNATVFAGTDVAYEWDFGDGTTGTGAVVTHIYPSLGVYTATVTAENSVSQAAAVTLIEVIPAVLLEEHFDTDIDDWTPFLNYHRNVEGQWYWDPDDGYNSSGGATQNAYAVPLKEAEDALLMWLQPGAEEWTDYRMEAKMILRTANYPQGFWVRGQYEDVGSSDPGGWVTGYYIMIGGGQFRDRHYVSLKQLQTVEDCWGPACYNLGNLYDFNNPHELTITKKDGNLQRYRWYTVAIEVRGANIKVWLDDVLYIDYTDTAYPFLTGTVGFKTHLADTTSFDDVVVTPLD
jgi:uncharacterized repeat protein (TIGR01451 family)